MEELLVYALLLYENIVPEEEYFKRLDELFLENPENDDLLYLEWETQVEKAIAYIGAHVHYKSFDYELFGSIMMEKIKVYYEKVLTSWILLAKCTDYGKAYRAIFKRNSHFVFFAMQMNLYFGEMKNRPEVFIGI